MCVTVVIHLGSECGLGHGLTIGPVVQSTSKYNCFKMQGRIMNSHRTVAISHSQRLLLDVFPERQLTKSSRSFSQLTLVNQGIPYAVRYKISAKLRPNKEPPCSGTNNESCQSKVRSKNSGDKIGFIALQWLSQGRFDVKHSVFIDLYNTFSHYQLWRLCIALHMSCIIHISVWPRLFHRQCFHYIYKFPSQYTGLSK